MDSVSARVVQGQADRTQADQEVAPVVVEEVLAVVHRSKSSKHRLLNLTANLARID